MYRNGRGKGRRVDSDSTERTKEGEKPPKVVCNCGGRGERLRGVR